MIRRERRHRERVCEKHFDALNYLLCSFYTLLERKPKPTDEEVRQGFIEHNLKWERYCGKHNLKEARELFKKEVSITWHNRYVHKRPQTKQLQDERNCTNGIFRSITDLFVKYAENTRRIVRMLTTTITKCFSTSIKGLTHTIRK